MTKYLNPNNEGVFIGPQISEWTKWKGLLTQLSFLEAKGTLWCLPNWYASHCKDLIWRYNETNDFKFWRDGWPRRQWCWRGEIDKSEATKVEELRQSK